MRKIIYIFCIGLLTSCAQKPVSEYVDKGIVINNRYENKYFNFTLDINPEWQVASDATLDYLKNASKEYLKRENKEMSKGIKASEINSMRLLMVSKHKFGSPIPNNPNFNLTIENMSRYSDVKNEADFFRKFEKTIEQSNGVLTKEGEITTLNFGSEQFYIMNTILHMRGIETKQKMCIKIMKGFSIGFIVTYWTTDEWNEIYRMLNTFQRKIT